MQSEDLINRLQDEVKQLSEVEDEQRHTISELHVVNVQLVNDNKRLYAKVAQLNATIKDLESTIIQLSNVIDFNERIYRIDERLDRMEARNEK